MLNQDASTRHLVYAPSWDIDSMISCCSASVVIRLEASYCTTKDRRNEQKALANDHWASSMPAQLRWIQNNLHNQAYAIPYNVAMTAVLADMLGESTGTLWIATDNIRRTTGDDVHLGPFSTAGLVDWLPKQGLADVYCGATNANESVQTWSWHLDTRACTEYVREHEAKYDKVRAVVKVLLPQTSDNIPHTHMRVGALQW